MLYLYKKASLLLLLPIMCRGSVTNHKDENEKIMKTPSSSSVTGTQGNQSAKNLRSPSSDQQQQERKTQGKIVGGDPVDIGQYKWYAAYDSPAACGGSLITPEFVLTAAHCTENFSSGFSGREIRIGAYCGFWDPSGCNDPSYTEELTFGASGVFEHPDYVSANKGFDFALIKLDTPSSISPVSIDQGTLSPSYTADKKLWAIGLGTLYSGGPVADKLRDVEVSYVTNAECDSDYWRENIDDSMMCAADPGEDACQGDSGGPLYDAENDVLVGVVSWGYGCADSQYPGVYGRISHVWPWIQEIVCENSLPNKPDLCEGYTYPTPPPSLAPCSDDEMTVELEIETDNWSHETSWDIIDTFSGNELAADGGYSDYTLYSYKYCFPSDMCLQFEMKDSYGDGIIKPEGYYFKVDGVILATSYDDSNGDFDYSESVEFGDGCGSPPTCSDDITWTKDGDDDTKNCAWVYKDPGARCTKESSGGVLASNACPVACGDLRTTQCDIPACDDDSWSVVWPASGAVGPSCDGFLDKKPWKRCKYTVVDSASGEDPQFFAYQYCSECRNYGNACEV